MHPYVFGVKMGNLFLFIFELHALLSGSLASIVFLLTDTFEL